MNPWFAILTTLFCSTQCEALKPFVPKSFLQSKSVQLKPKAKPPQSNICMTHIFEEEGKYGIPQNLLMAIAKVESGKRVSNGTFVPWPWTANVNGRPYYFKSRAEAIRRVRGFLAAGERSIDVGCMQINLKHHPKAFASLEEAFDPAQNVKAGARLLASLKRRLGDWQRAVSHYHSATPARHIPYARKVMARWNVENGYRKPSPLAMTRLARLNTPAKLKPVKPRSVKVLASEDGRIFLASNSNPVCKITRFRSPPTMSTPREPVKRVSTRG